MLTISKPLSAGQAQTYHVKEFTAAEQNYWKQGETIQGYASRGTQEQLATLKNRMDWQHIPWYTIVDDFDKDFGVDQWHGHNVFIRDENDKIFRTYLINGRGDEAMGSVWSYLDATPLGRQEDWEDSPAGYPQTPRYKWWRWINGGAGTTLTATKIASGRRCSIKPS